MGLREVAVSRSLDNITILILGLKGLKRTIKKLNQGVPLSQIRQQHYLEQRNQQNTYAKDFFEVEINETDLVNLNEADSAGNTIDCEIFEIGGGSKASAPDSGAQQSPQKTTNKV